MNPVEIDVPTLQSDLVDEPADPPAAACSGKPRSMPTPLRIGLHWCVRLPGVAAEHGGDLLDLVIPRGAFGSGEHETTASCLEELERLAPGRRALDVGCGSGVLALAALRMGFERAIGVDIDLKAVTTARRAAVLNRLGDRLVVVHGTLDAVAPAAYDLILANLHGDVLLELAGSILATAGSGASILISGIAWEFAFPVREEFVGLGCSVVRERWLEEYVTIVLTAPDRDDE